MTYDEQLADRVRHELAGHPAVVERKMFGGLAFLIGGHMAVVASGKGGLMVRVHPDGADHAIATTSARLAQMRGRPMRGWLRLNSEDVRTSSELARWIDLSTGFVTTLPPKR